MKSKVRERVEHGDISKFAGQKKLMTHEPFMNEVWMKLECLKELQEEGQLNL